VAELELKRPSLEHLGQYVAALKRGWSPDNVGGRKTADAQLVQIAEDAEAFLATQDDPEGRGPPIRLPDGREVQRLPGYYRWIWDGEFCGTVGFRWAPGTPDLPAHVLGHIGYGVVPWKQGRGYAAKALALLLPDAGALGLPYVELTTDPANVASQKVITANGGMLMERFVKPDAYGEGLESLRYRIAL
jgi:predicted acetyltransferase